jgi:hypothetical protein
MDIAAIQLLLRIPTAGSGAAGSEHEDFHYASSFLI